MHEVLQPYVLRMTKVSEHVLHAYSLVDAEIQAKNVASAHGGKILGVGTTEAFEEVAQLQASAPSMKKRQPRIDARPCGCPTCTPPSAA